MGHTQKVRQNKSKTRQVTNSVKDPNIYVAKSIQDANQVAKLAKGQNQHAVRKASMGIISPNNNNSLLDSKLVFSGSQLTTAIQKTVEQFTSTKETAPSNPYGD